MKDGSTIEVSKFKLVVFLGAEELASASSKLINSSDPVDPNPQNIEEVSPEEFPMAGLFPTPPESGGNDEKGNQEINDFQDDLLAKLRVSE